MGINVSLIRAEFTDLPTSVRVAAAVELAAKIAALADILRRPSSSLRGPKWAWILAQAVNGVGPAAYWLAARK